MTEQKERLKKLYALALRGVGGEKEQAEAIAQAEIAESVAADLAEKRKQAADTLARCEKEL